MSGDQIPSLRGKKRRQMPGVCPEWGGGDVEASIWLVHKIIPLKETDKYRLSTEYFSYEKFNFEIKNGGAHAH